MATDSPIVRLGWQTLATFVLSGLMIAPAELRAEPTDIVVVDDRSVEATERRSEVTRTLFAVLYGLAAPGSPDEIRVQVRGPGRAGGASGSLGTWLASAESGAKRGDWSPANALADVPSITLRMVLAPGDGSWKEAAHHLSTGPVAALAPPSGPVAEACAKNPDCSRYEAADPLGAAGAILLTALSDTGGVHVSVAERIVLDPGVARLVVIAPGDQQPMIPTLGGGSPFPSGEAASDRVVTARAWDTPSAGKHPVVDARGKPLRVLALVVYPTISVTDCTLVNDDSVRWRFASPGIEWNDELAGQIAFEVQYRDAQGQIEGVTLTASEVGTLPIPGKVRGPFTIQPVTVTSPTVVLGERTECQPAVRELAARIVVSRDGRDILVRASFADLGGEPVPAPKVLEEVRLSVTLDSGETAPLQTVDGGAEVRFDGLMPGRHLVILGPATSRRLSVGRAEVEVDVGEHSAPGGGAPWKAALIAVLFVVALEVMRPWVLNVFRRRRKGLRGTIALYVGDALLNERALDHSTAYPVLLAGIRELPIAQGEVLTRAEVVWDGWRPTFRAVVLGKRDEQSGQRRMRIETHPLSGATAFEFSNVRVEFIAAG